MLYHAQLANTELYDIRLWQCTNFAQHWHSKTEIYLCLQGKMKICIEETMYCLNQDDAVFVCANEAHEIFCDVPNTQVVLIAFGYDLLGNDYRKILNLSIDIPFFNLKDKDISPEILQPIVQIRDVLYQTEGDAILRDWKIRSNVYAIAAYLFEHNQNKPFSAKRLLRAKHLEKMYGTLQYISENYCKTITVKQAAAVAGYDRSYFCKQFRKTTGMTFHRYLNYYRISEACRLMSDSKLSLSAVAEQSGFASQKNLSRLFRDVLGICPSQYRKLSQEEKDILKTHKNILH